MGVRHCARGSTGAQRGGFSNSTHRHAKTLRGGPALPPGASWGSWGGVLRRTWEHSTACGAQREGSAAMSEGPLGLKGGFCCHTCGHTEACRSGPLPRPGARQVWKVRVHCCALGPAGLASRGPRLRLWARQHLQVGFCCRLGRLPGLRGGSATTPRCLLGLAEGVHHHAWACTAGHW